MPRWARGRADANHEELVAALRDLGWDVIPTYQLKGFVDAVGRHPRHKVTLFEFKMPKGSVTKAQEDLFTRGWPIVILRTIADAELYTLHGVWK